VRRPSCVADVGVRLSRRQPGRSTSCTGGGALECVLDECVDPPSTRARARRAADVEPDGRSRRQGTVPHPELGSRATPGGFFRADRALSPVRPPPVDPAHRAWGHGSPTSRVPADLPRARVVSRHSVRSGVDRVVPVGPPWCRGGRVHAGWRRRWVHPSLAVVG
jgi:hypothetical protein